MCVLIDRKYVQVKLQGNTTTAITVSSPTLSGHGATFTFLNPGTHWVSPLGVGGWGLDSYLMFYTQSVMKGYIRAELNEFLPHVQILIHYLIHMPPLKIGEILGK